MSLVHNASIVRSGLVLHLDAANPKSYPGSGTIWYDLSGTKSHGTLTNGPTFDPSNNGSILFDGVNDYVLGNTAASYTSGYTNVIWVQLTTVSPEQHLINLKGVTQFYVLSGTLGSSNYGNLTGGTILANTWYMLAQSRAADGTGTIYINGNFVASSALPTPGTITQYVIGNYVLFGNYCLSGRVSSSMIYNRVLSDTEMKQNFEALRGRYGI